MPAAEIRLCGRVAALPHASSEQLTNVAVAGVTWARAAGGVELLMHPALLRKWNKTVV